MGLQDRDYYRESSPSPWPSVGGQQAVTWLLALSVTMFIAQLFMGLPGRGNALVLALDFHAPAIQGGELWRLITCYFVQPNSSLVSLILGLWFLYWAGSELETAHYGARNFLLFYFTAALLISLAKLAVAWLGDEAHRHVRSGGSALPGLAVLVLFALHYPNRTILFFFIIPMPIWVLALLAVGGYTLMYLGGGLRQEVAGAAAASLTAFLHFRSGGQWLSGLFTFRRRLKIYTPPRTQERPTPVITGLQQHAGPVRDHSPPRSTVDEHLEAKLDEILEKVARTGRASLTAEENEILMRASEVYKRRRN